MRKSIDHVNEKAGAAPPAAAPTADEVFEAVHALMHRYRAEQYRVLRGTGQELTHMDAKVLGYFARHPGATQKELSLHSGRDKGQLARLIAGLKERGLLDATPDEADRRNIRLRLTAEGRSVQQALQRQARKVSEAAVAGLDAQERRQLVVLLGRLDANLGQGT